MADLTVTLTESLELEGETIEGTQTKTITGVTSIYHAKLTNPEICHLFRSTSFSVDDMDNLGVGIGDSTPSIVYLRITNVDDTDSFDLRINGDALSSSYLGYINLNPSESIIFFKAEASWIVHTSSQTVPLTHSGWYNDLLDIKFTGTDRYYEVFMASTGSTY